MGMKMRMFLRVSSTNMNRSYTQKHAHTHKFTHLVNVNVNGNRCAARNGKNERQSTVTAGPFWGINFKLQLQSASARELI